MDPKELRDQLIYFTGTEHWTRWSSLFPNYLLTDGALFLADNAGAYWLMDLIASYHKDPKIKEETFQVWKLEVKDSKGKVTCDDGNDHILVTQEIKSTDFPLEEIELYCIQDEDPYWVVLLPSEY